MAEGTFAEKLYDILVKHGSVEPHDAQAVHDTFADSPQEYFDDFLLEEGLVEETDLLRALAEYYQVPSVDVTGLFFDTFILRKFPKGFLLRHAVIPLEVEENMLMIIANEPEKEGLESALRDYVSYDINFMVGIRQHIIDSIREFYDKSLTEIDEDSGPI